MRAPRPAAPPLTAAPPAPTLFDWARCGPILLIAFSLITWYYSIMLVDAYRYPNVDGPTRNYTYIQAVDRYLGARAPPRPTPPRPCSAARCRLRCARARAPHRLALTYPN